MRSHHAPVLATFLVCLGLAGLVTPVEASRLDDERNLRWESYRDLTSAEFSEHFDRLRNDGMMMVDVDAYQHGNGIRYAMVWRENRDGRGWAEHRDLTSAGYGQKWEEYKNRGYRPIDIESYQVGGAQRFAGIWVQNREGYGWSSRRGLTDAEYRAYFEEQRAKGYRPIDIEAYPTAGGIRYAAIWMENRGNVAWIQLRNMTRESYQQEVDTRSASGFTVTDFEAYQTSSGTRYAAIWERLPGTRASQVRTDRTELQFANLWRQYRDEGYRLIDFERYSTPSGNRYGGIWIENSDRFRYARKCLIDDAVTTYREDNILPSISAVVMRNGQIIYRRGFGFSDILAGRIAHAETIYNIASVSKTIGGSIAARLEERGRLRDGTNVTLDLTLPTANYLDASLPSQHTHTVQQLLAHLGCVAHYGTNPNIENQTTHYTTQTDAVRSLWDTGLVTSCTIGTTRSYSTPGFTFLGAVLESVTGRDTNRLVNEEVTQPLGLSSMRVQFAMSTLPGNYERATPYDNSGDPTTYPDSSWKALGGGIESNAVDLARFGWFVLRGDMVSATTRDNRLWSPVATGCGASNGGVCQNGLAWSLGTVNGRRVAEHDGKAIGARSYLRVYRDDGLVIAVLTNKRTNSSGADHNPATLVTKIGDIVLAP